MKTIHPAAAFLLLLALFPVLQAQAVIISQGCYEDYDYYTGEAISRTCTTQASYTLEGMVTLRNPYDGLVWDAMPISGSLSQFTWLFEDYYGSSSYGDISSTLTMGIEGLGTYTLNQVDYLMDGGQTYGYSSDAMTGSFTTDGTARWLIEANGINALIRSLDGDGDGINGINLYTDGSLFMIADVELSAVPVPAAAWLFGSGLLGLAGMVRRCKTIR